LLTVREYFKTELPQSRQLQPKADALWKGVEWDWYTKEKMLYTGIGHTYGWEMNFKLEGYNECLITYVMGAASPTHQFNRHTYHQGWARNWSKWWVAVWHSRNFQLQRTSGNVGPLFWAQYSYLGLDPSHLTDQYADYWALTQNHSKIIKSILHCKSKTMEVL
jgi:hypothetical protein